MLNEFWDDFYADDAYAYGLEPNAFLKEQLPNLTRGTILFPCEGEGRNAVYATKQAWVTYAFDISERAKAKAMKLAEEHFVNFVYDVCALEDYVFGIDYDAIGLFFTHFAEAKQEAYFKLLIDNLKPGGVLIGELFSTEQIAYKNKYESGGPSDIGMLMTIDKLKAYCPNIVFEILEASEVELKEGSKHDGKAHTIRFLGKKLD